MKKQYTKKQITEAIAYWEKQLEIMNENEHYFYADDNFKHFHTDVNFKKVLKKLLNDKEVKQLKVVIDGKIYDVEKFYTAIEDSGDGYKYPLGSLLIMVDKHSGKKLDYVAGDDINYMISLGVLNP